MWKMSIKGMEAYSLNTVSKPRSRIVPRLFIILLVLGQAVFLLAGVSPDNQKSALVAADIWNSRRIPGNEVISEVYVSVNPAHLAFKADGDKYKALFRLEVSAYSPSGEMVQSRYVEDKIITTNVEQATTGGQLRLSKLSFHLQPGSYKAYFRLIDLNTGKRMTLEKDWNIPAILKESFSVSDLLFARREYLNGGQRSAILPYPAAIYGRVQNRIFFYFETYLEEGSRKDSARISLKVLNDGNETVFSKEEMQHFRRGYRPTFISFNTADLPPGVYTASLRVSHSSGNIILREKRFFVYQSPIDVRFHAYSDLLKELELIANPEEMKMLESAPVEKRQEAIINFWRGKDRNTSTRINEKMLEFYRRIGVARQFYWRGNGADGGFTDRGKVYVMYGKPSHITHRTDLKSRSRYEVWIYSKLTIEAVFVDVLGINDYRLLQPLSLLSN